MSLKDKIQNEIVDSTIKLSVILRKAKILAQRLKSNEIKNWVEQELNGYKSIEGLPDYRKTGTQTYGHFSGSFQSSLRNVAIPTAGLPKEVQEFATKFYFFQGIRELESLTESGEKQFQFPWPADYVLIIADKIYEDMVCMHAWRHISVGQIEHVLDTVRNRLLTFVLELEELDPSAGEELGNKTHLSPDKVSQVFNNYILGSYNVVSSGTNFTQNVEYIVKGDFESIKRTLQSWGIKDDDISVLAKAFDADGKRSKEQGMGPKVKEWLGTMIQKILAGASKMSLETAPLLLSNAISSYYGWK